jgi:RNA polymerase sigma-54 factor
MALAPRLDLRTTQTLVMTPQLQQAIKLLQMSNLELGEYVERQLEQNPFLERDETSSEDIDRTEERREPGEASGDPGGKLTSVDHAVADATGAVSDAALDADYGELFDSEAPTDSGGGEIASGAGMTVNSRAGGNGFDGTESSLESTVASRSSLREHLTQQLFLQFRDPVERMIGQHLIDMLDDAGYLPWDLEPIASTLGCSMAQIEAVLVRMQQFEPSGIFARSLAECLAVQLAERNRLTPEMESVLGHLDLVAKRDFGALAKIAAVSVQQVACYVAELRTLNPKPALAYDTEVAQPVTPDIMMRAQPGGSWSIELNSETLPRVLVNNQYYARVFGAARNREEKLFINECFHDANWLVKSLHQRATTILKVATEIVRQQDAFFAVGVQGLRPLILRQVAEAVGLHESTVSRVTSNKYMETPRGIYELKYFFNQAVGGSAGGEAHSAEWVRHRVRALIDGEPPEQVHSDDAIVDVLSREGIDIARRTVAKYREALGIPSSVQRRKEKMASRLRSGEGLLDTRRWRN